VLSSLRFLRLASPASPISPNPARRASESAELSPVSGSEPCEPAEVDAFPPSFAEFVLFFNLSYYKKIFRKLQVQVSH